MGIDLELLPLRSGDTDSFNIAEFYQEILGLDDESAKNLPEPTEKFDELLSRCALETSQFYCIILCYVHYYWHCFQHFWLVLMFHNLI